MTATPPDFVIIGAMRAGTTALADALSAHQDIGMARLKETDYFIKEKNFPRGAAWYRGLFPDDKSVLGEASPNYTKNDVFRGVPERLHAARPDAKLIYIVRDPVERFCSQYAHSWLMGAKLPPPETLLDEAEGEHILAASMYARQLRDYLNLFPEEQIEIVDFDAFTASRAPALAAICRFLGVEPLEAAADGAPVNSAASLARTPGWLLKLSEQRPMVALRAATPPGLRRSIKRLAAGASKDARRAPALSGAVKARIADRLSRDAAEFRTLTGLAFSQWAV